MNNYLLRYAILISGLSLMMVSCSDSGGSSESTDGDIDNRSGANIEDIDIENHDDLPSAEVDASGKCVDKTLKDEPGVCGCRFEDIDIDGDGNTDCPRRMIPEKALPPLQEISGDCGGWTYPKHHIIRYPKLPEYGYEVTIDTEKYHISKVYDVSKADETTNGLNQAIADYKAMGYQRIVIPPGHYPLTSQGIVPGSDVAIIMSDDVTLQMIPVDRYDCGLITITKSENVYIEGGTLIGERYEHPGPASQEECGGMQIFHSGHVFVNGVTIKSVHGDGIMVLDYTPGDEASIGSDVIIANCEISDAYRNGIAIIQMDGIRITNNHIHHTNGTAPQFGIDFEPNSRTTRKIHRAIVDHNRFHDNVAGDLISYGQNTFIEYNQFDIGDLEKMIDNPFIHRASNGTYVFYRNKVAKHVNNSGCSNQLFCSYAIPSKDGKRVIPDESMQKYPSFFVENEIPRTRVQLTYMNRFCIKNNIMHEGHLSFSGIRDARVFNNRAERFSEHPYTGDYSCQNVYGGQAGGNMTCRHDESGQEICTEHQQLNKLNTSPYDTPFTVNGQWY